MKGSDRLSVGVRCTLYAVVLILKMPECGAQASRTTRLYRPHYGYEPYWAGGQWVLHGDPGASSTRQPVMVGPDHCEEMYRGIEEVCGRRVSDQAVWAAHCTETPCPFGWPDEYYQYKTFPSYCHFLDAEYRSKEKNRFVFVHLGKCIHQNFYFYDNMYSGRVWERAHSRMLALNEAFAGVGSRTTWRCGRMCHSNP